MGKRLFDLIAAGGAVVVLSPLLAALALAVRADSPGPAFYLQERVGRNGKPFRIVKFRTMRHDSDRGGRQITVGRDPRITRVGRVLRQWKLDELPQLFNVVRGEMSLVGPRPEVPKYVAQYTEQQRRVLDVRPGITDLASIEFRDENALLEGRSDPERYYVQEIMPRKLELNLEYIERQGLAFDAWVIAATAWRVVAPRRRGDRADREA